MTINQGKEPAAGKAGYTLAEALIAVVVLGIAASGVLLPFAGGAAVRAEGVRRTLAGKLAHDLLEEIINTRFDQIVATYDGYAEPQGQVKQAGGEVFTDPAYANFSRYASCQYIYVSQQAGIGQSVFILVTVRVCYRGTELARFTRLVGA
jgi:prepilin-type N-terminal cleavage/methylation domain-containing protein